MDKFIWICDESRFLPGKGIVVQNEEFDYDSIKGESLVKQGLCKKVTKKVKTEKAED